MRAFRLLIHPLVSLLAVLTVSLLGGCAHRSPDPWALPPVEAGVMTGRYVQSLRLERQGRTLELMAVIENDGNTFTLVGLSPMGQRLLRLTWSGGKVAQESDPNLPVHIDGEAILRDVVFANWPEAALRTVFADTRWRAAFSGADRSLAWNGRPWLSVRPDTGAAGPMENTDTAGGAASTPGIVVDHLAEGYRVHVATVERDAP